MIKTVEIGVTIIICWLKNVYNLELVVDVFGCGVSGLDSQYAEFKLEIAWEAIQFISFLQRHMFQLTIPQ